MNRILIVGEASSCAAALANSLRDYRTCEHCCTVPSAAELRSLQAMAVIYCGEVSLSAWEDFDAEELSRDAQRLAELTVAATAANLPLVLVSSDAIFHGPRMFRAEDAPLDYSEQRSASIQHCENWVLAAGGLVLRTHLLDSANQRESFAQCTLQAIHDSLRPRVHGTWYATPISTGHFAAVVARCVELKLTGLLHAGGAQRVSQWEFATALAAAINIPLKTPRAWLPEHANLNITRETSLDSRRLQRELGKPLPMLRDCVTELAATATTITSRLAA